MVVLTVVSIMMLLMMRTNEMIGEVTIGLLHCSISQMTMQVVLLMFEKKIAELKVLFPLLLMENSMVLHSKDH